MVGIGMSDVTTVLLTFGALESHETLTKLQQRLVASGIGEIGDLGESWSDVAERGRRWGGTKYPEIDLYGAAYNHLDLGKLMSLLLATPWDDTESVQLMVCGQEDARFTVYELHDGTWQALRSTTARS
jgi:hypothetical protein